MDDNEQSKGLLMTMMTPPQHYTTTNQTMMRGQSNDARTKVWAQVMEEKRVVNEENVD